MKAGLDNWIDILVIGLYFFFVLLVGVWSMCRKERNTVKGYFLAGRSMLWFPIGASLFASNIGSEHFIGLAGSGAAAGIAVAAFEWGAALCLPLLGWVFLPVYLSSGIFTIPEYLGKRFGGRRIQTYLTILALFLYICTKISVDIYAGSVFVQQALGWNTYISIVALLAVTAVYTIAGGLAAVIFTDTLQTIIMLVGATILAVMGFYEVGGLSGLMYKYPFAVPHATPDEGWSANSTNITLANLTTSHCGQPRKDAFHILRDPVNSDLPWPGVLIRSTFVSTWYWCADQVIVQRALAAKNIGHARAATLMAGYLKFLPMFLIIMPGMISRVLFPETVACADEETCMKVCENPVGCSNVAYPQLILGLAPVGMRGLMMAVMMAALMSSLTSIFNSAATLFTMDIWRKIRKTATERELLVVGKIFVVVLVGISILWIPLIKAAQQGQLFLYIQAVTGYLAPPICSVFLLAIFVPRINEPGAFWGMVIGQVTGVTRMILDFIYPSPKCGEVDERPAIIAKVHFTYFASMVLILTAIVTVVISLITKRQDRDELKELTFWTVQRVRSPPKENTKQHQQEADIVVKSEVNTNPSLSPDNEKTKLGETYDNVKNNTKDSTSGTSVDTEENMVSEMVNGESLEMLQYNNVDAQMRNKRIRLSRSSYASDRSLEIHMELQRKMSLIAMEQASAKQEQEQESTHNIKGKTVKELSQRKLYISTKFNWFLNINAIILICVFVFLYCIFH